ncbi:MAG: hypothetical protein RMJ37_07230 [Spirochaetia bacterium]|nr:hypothetical protein [Spirochaetota bacterium]MCX8096094.1 hypothetical protein [Spirochaetota bacterium]MDW8113107.1 hypothetical protein [Spirochaetia bacterium]
MKDVEEEVYQIPEWYKEGIEKCYREGWYGLDDDCECNEPGGEVYGLDDVSFDQIKDNK